MNDVKGTPTPDFDNNVAQDLQKQGYNVVGTRSSDTDVAVTKLTYPADAAEAARTLAYATGATETVVKRGSGNTLILKVGADYSGVTPVITKKKKKDPTDTSAPKTADTSFECVS